MFIEIPDFTNGGMIPDEYTCQGKNVNPQIIVKQVPSRAQSLVCIVDDPDAPKKIWVHWVVYDIPAQETVTIKKDSNPGVEGVNDSQDIGYDGPCPPSGVHRYYFKIYALDTKLSRPKGAMKEEILHSMQGHIIAQAEYMGRYMKK
jgi:Raf kinase inhibitor-like YbhB/YbcL family protein